MNKNDKKIVRDVADKLDHINYALGRYRRLSKTGYQAEKAWKLFANIRGTINYICKDLWELTEKK